MAFGMKYRIATIKNEKLPKPTSPSTLKCAVFFVFYRVKIISSDSSQNKGVGFGMLSNKLCMVAIRCAQVLCLTLSRFILLYFEMNSLPIYCHFPGHVYNTNV